MDKTIQLKVNGSGLLNYAKAGQDAIKDIRKALRVVLKAGRNEARQQIANQFRVRTGVLRRQARKMQIKTIVKPAEVKGQITPLPNLLNIFERGATLAKGRGFLRPRPVIAPASKVIDRMAEEEVSKILSKVGR